ncbi:GcrA family cell cycle regulator [Pelagibacterium xiamenense]|uniref:GcrA family cell cycle regulator n=1 Tax=Pelagibacterium xiamenense TaxID=2901140 RepID=UPI001E4277F3|nr:GcrA family cell cycle regulator [Pelagibacterium xiamenense]MCD7058993.1 GcrA cell cycle regulator [Pelagibacterium xiamenense]
MTWTDERVALLKKLWMEGLSASQIAAELSNGVTRNAVIGKVHRLKLSARAKPTNVAPRAKAPRASTPRRPGSGGSGGSSRSGGSGTSYAASQRRTTSAPVMGATALKIEETLEVEVEVQNKVAELVIPPEERISLLELSEKTCKWPIGDPMNSDFHFCGRESDEGKPYCDFHSRRAYHQIDRKKR